MRLNLNKLILEEMANGVIQVDRNGAVVGNNRASEPWVARFRMLQPYLRRAIDEEVKGLAQFPMPLEQELVKQEPKDHNWKVWLCKDGRSGYAIFIVDHPHRGASSSKRPAPAEEPAVRTDGPFMALLGEAARKQLAELQSLLRGPMDAAARDDARILRSAQGAELLLQHLSDLSSLKQRDLVFADQRIALQQLVGGAIEAARGHPNDKAVSYVFEPGVEQHGVLYGNFEWLSYALGTLLCALYRGAPKQSCIEVGSHQFGDFIVVKGSVRWGGNARPVAAPNPPQGVRASDAQGPAHASIVDSAAMLISERIIELHSGRLRMTRPASDADEGYRGAIESFQLTLLTGMPEHDRSRASCAECPVVRQSHAFAQDFSELLNRQHSR